MNVQYPKKSPTENPGSRLIVCNAHEQGIERYHLKSVVVDNKTLAYNLRISVALASEWS